MTLRTSIRSIATLLFGMLAAWSAQATPTVTITVIEGTTATTYPVQVVEGSSAVNLDSDLPKPGSPAPYGNFSIQQCPGCAGRARVFVNEGSTSVSKLTLTDALITYNGTNLPSATIIIAVTNGTLSTSGPAGDYPFATEASGTFTAPLGTGTTLDGFDRILVRATAGGPPGTGPGFSVCTSNIGIESVTLTAATTATTADGTCTIDNPILDPLETNPDQASIVAPPFLSAGVAQFAPKEQQIITCDNIPAGDGTPPLCQPTLGMTATISLKPRHSARIPGSLTTAHVPLPCDAKLGDFRGCEVMANYFASLGPKGFKVYDARLEPTPGSLLTAVVRSVTSSPQTWTTTRGRVPGDEDDQGRDGGDNVSATRVRLETNGGGEVRAKGLCQVGATDCSNDLPVHVYCAADTRPVFETVIHLNSKGDGLARVVFAVPCDDPAVLIMDEGDNFWVAAPSIH